jgi:PII-like signaling protein
MLRVYVRRGETRPGPTLWGRLFPKRLSLHIVHEALRSGITMATVTPGHAGYARGATRVTPEPSELGLVERPICVELIAPKATLESFIVDHYHDLSSGALVLLEGVPLPAGLGGEYEELSA